MYTGSMISFIQVGSAKKTEVEHDICEAVSHCTFILEKIYVSSGG